MKNELHPKWYNFWQWKKLALLAEEQNVKLRNNMIVCERQNTDLKAMNAKLFEENKALQWQVLHTPRYKIGQVLNDYRITAVSVKNGKWGLIESGAAVLTWLIFVRKAIKDMLNSHIDGYHYVYSLEHTNGNTYNNYPEKIIEEFTAKKPEN